MKRPDSKSIESARSYSNYESPTRTVIDGEIRDEIIPVTELAKGLMKNRQLGNPMTPKGE